MRRHGAGRIRAMQCLLASVLLTTVCAFEAPVTAGVAIDGAQGGVQGRQHPHPRKAFGRFHRITQEQTSGSMGSAPAPVEAQSVPSSSVAPVESLQTADGSFPVYPGSKPAPTVPQGLPPPPPQSHENVSSAEEGGMQVMPAVMPIDYVEPAPQEGTQVGSGEVMPLPMPPQQTTSTGVPVPVMAMPPDMPPQPPSPPSSGGAMPPQMPPQALPRPPLSPISTGSGSQGPTPRVPPPPPQTDESNNGGAPQQMAPSLPSNMFLDRNADRAGGGGGGGGQGGAGFSSGEGGSNNMLQLPPLPPQAMRQQQAAVLAQRSQVSATSTSGSSSSTSGSSPVPCFAVAREANLSVVFSSAEFRSCPMAKVLLLTKAQGGPEFYNWDSSGLSDAAAFSLSLRARDAENEASARPLVMLTGEGPIRRKPLSVLHVDFDADGLSLNAAPAFLTEAGPVSFDRVAFTEFDTGVVHVVGDNNAKLSRCSFATSTMMPMADYKAKAGRGPPFVQVQRGSLVADGTTFRKALGHAISSVGKASQVTLTRMQFLNGEAPALFLNDSRASCDNCTFSANKAKFGAGVQLASGAGFGCRRCRFVGNTANSQTLGGAAIYLHNSSLALHEAIFQGGVASSGGGAIYAEGSSFVFGDGLMVGKNSAPAIQTLGNVSVQLDNTCFADNGPMEESDVARSLSQKSPLNDTRALLLNYCSFYSNDSLNAQDFFPASEESTPTLNATQGSNCSSTCNAKWESARPKAAAELPPPPQPTAPLAPSSSATSATSGAGVSSQSGSLPSATGVGTQGGVGGGMGGGLSGAWGGGNALANKAATEKQALKAYSSFCDFMGRPLYRKGGNAQGDKAGAGSSSLHSGHAGEKGEEGASSTSAEQLSAPSTSTSGSSSTSGGLLGQSAEADTCWGHTARLVLYIQSVGLSDGACFVNGSASPYVVASIGDTTLWTVATQTVNQGAAVADVSQFLELGCQSPREPLYIEVRNLLAARNGTRCAWWRMDDWTSLLDSDGTLVLSEGSSSSISTAAKTGARRLQQMDQPQSSLLLLGMPLQTDAAQLSLALIAENTSSLATPMSATVDPPPLSNKPVARPQPSDAETRNRTPNSTSVLIGVLIPLIILLSCCIVGQGFARYMRGRDGDQPLTEAQQAALAADPAINFGGAAAAHNKGKVQPSAPPHPAGSNHV